jgi:hypothetical protein
MKMLEQTETQELLLGTWVAVALLVEMLVDRGLVPREELLLLLGSAEVLACDSRRTALAALRLLVERGFG